MSLTRTIRRNIQKVEHYGSRGIRNPREMEADNLAKAEQQKLNTLKLKNAVTCKRKLVNNVSSVLNRKEPKTLTKVEYLS